MSTDELAKAFREAKKLTEEEQQRFGAFLLKELESEKRWKEQFQDSIDTLDELADEALKAHDRSDTQPLEPDKL